MYRFRALFYRVILDEAAETGLEAEDDTGDVALLSPNKMETLGKIENITRRV